VARKPRQEVAGGTFHVYARGNDRRPIFVDDDDYGRYVRKLGVVVLRFRWRCLSYCLMPNHVHLLVETPEPNLGRGMHMLQGEYAQEFNRRHGRVGHLFQERFGSSLVTTNARFFDLVSYIALNPVAARLCSRPEGWTWSSHADTIGPRPPRWLDVERLFLRLGSVADYRDLIAIGLSGMR
jgi:REP element-mobilizing transposase RayT